MRTHASKAEPDDVNAEKRRGSDRTAFMTERDLTADAATRDELENRTNARVVTPEVDEGRRKSVETCL